MQAIVYGAIGGLIAVVIIVILFASPAMTIDQILENKDCAALEKYAENQIYDEDLNLTSSQKKGMTNLALECAMKAAGNIFSP